MFKTETGRVPAGLPLAVAEAERNYTIKKNDYIEIKLYANKGEKLIDFNIGLQGSANTAGVATNQENRGPRFLVQDDGYVKLPQLGMVKLEGYTLIQADSVLENAYNNFYVEPFVNTNFANKRVVVLSGSKGQVIPLVNEQMNLIEVLALFGGVESNARVRNIRLIRGDLKNPEVYIVDLSTIDGMMKSSLLLKANDIIYVEPVRKPIIESISDVTPFVSLISGLISIITLIALLRNGI
jgi:polysaccharide export outer membrane protein